MELGSSPDVGIQIRIRVDLLCGFLDQIIVLAEQIVCFLQAVDQCQIACGGIAPFVSS